MYTHCLPSHDKTVPRGQPPRDPDRGIHHLTKSVRWPKKGSSPCALWCPGLHSVDALFRDCFSTQTELGVGEVVDSG